MKLSQKIRLSVVIGIILSMVLSIVGFASDCEDIRQSVLRLHVIAASDTDADQALKLKVRDAVLTAGADIFDGSVNVNNAVEKLTPRLHELESAAEKTVRENGCDFDVDLTLSREFFNTRTYEDITLPAGKYLAVRVVIDEGQGQNWWCVMFPSLCLSAARVHTDIDDVLDEKGVRIVEKNPRYEPRFKIIELIEKLKD